ncbi:MAG TPA: CDP-alcohol phosphatidyltransferase family protein [Candidatus Limnocylindria bacterium]
MNLADAIGVLRALAVVPIAFAILAEQHALALALFALAALSDAVDGWLARHAGAATRHGVLLDPLADKVLVVGTLIALSAAHTGWPVTVVTVLVAARELAVAGLRIGAFARAIALPADRLAKLKTAAELVGTGMIVWTERPWAVLGAGLVGLAFLLGLYTLPRYMAAARRAS